MIMGKYALKVSTRHAGYDGPRRVTDDSVTFDCRGTVKTVKFGGDSETVWISEVVVANPEE